ncbi:MAG: DUF2726 domain-containing protein, partial [Rubrivivax sp.]
MPQTVPLILASLSLALLMGAWLLWRLSARQLRGAALPAEWALTARPVFSSDERRVDRQLREALPHHVVLAKLPLVRFCQPTDPQEGRYWHRLLGSIHVGFAICSANGRVLAAIDLEGPRIGSLRSLQIKQAVLSACRVRYLRCLSDHLPSGAELQLLLPQFAAAARGPLPAPTQSAARESLHAAASRRHERRTLWQDSGSLQDSFFGVDDGRSELG